MATSSRGMAGKAQPVVPLINASQRPRDVPPPSTLAAALISNVSASVTSKTIAPRQALQSQAQQRANGGSSSATSSNTSSENFQQLLHEVARFEDRGSQTPLEQRILHHQKLIYVISKAVLDVLSRDDPFLPRQKLVAQAAEALDVLIATIRETPSVLTKPAGVPPTGKKSKSLQNELASLPVWIWLFPKLLVLAGREQCESLQPRITEFFCAVVGVVSRVPQLWHLTTLVFCYLRECVDAALNRLASFTVTTSTAPLCLPPSSIEGRLESYQAIDSTRLESCTYIITSVPQVIQHIRCLLYILTQISGRKPSSDDSMHAFEDFSCWIFDTYLAIEDVEKKWRRDPMLRKTIPVAEDSVKREVYSATLVSLTAIQLLLSSLPPGPDVLGKQKGSMSLTTLCTAFIEDVKDLSDIEGIRVAGQEVAVILADVLLDIAATSEASLPNRQIVQSRLIPSLLQLTQSSSDSTLGNELKVALLALDKVANMTDIPRDMPTFVSEDLHRKLGRLRILEPVSPPGTARPTKRRRLVDRTNMVDQVADKFASILGCGDDIGAAGLKNLEKSLEDNFSLLEDEGKCNAVRYLSYLPCASAGTLFLIIDNMESQLDTENLRCSVCDDMPDKTHPSREPNSSQEMLRVINGIVISLFAELTESLSFIESRRPRVLAMLGLRRLATHFKDFRFQNLESSVVGQWSLKSLKSSIRELRIAAGRTLAQFLRDCGNHEVTSKNWTNVLGILHSISNESPLHLLETTILAWGQLGRVAKNDNLNVVLHRLVEYLGHTNLIVSGVAFNEILNLATALRLSPTQLFAPYWQNIAVTAVKDLQSKPQTAQLLADLMGYSVDDLLVETQSYTLPSLVLMNRKEIIQRITKVQGKDDPWQILLGTSNTGPIMALLLVQRVSNLGSFIMTLLRSISARFKELDLVELLNLVAVGTAYELFKAAGEETDERKTRVFQAIEFLAENYAVAGDKSYGKSTDKVGAFLELNVLGLLARFSDRINDPRVATLEKQRCLRGLQEMILIGKVHIRSALPQIFGGLQSALSQDDLRHDAFSAWTTMIMCLQDVDVYDMLESTFATIILHYESFAPETKSLADDIIAHLLSKRHDILKQNIDVIPSLADIPEFTTFETEIKRMRKGLDLIQQYNIFHLRLSHENEFVVKQALNELLSYLQKNQAFLQASASSEQPDKVVGQLVRSIIDACVRFNGNNYDIARLSAECIGLIGCLDPNRVEAVRERTEVIVVSNFGEAEETTDFVLFLLQEVLVKAFLSASNPRAQGFLSFAMQELLAKCDISSIWADRTRLRGNPDAEALYEKWLALPESTRATLEPFLTSKYLLTDPVIVEAKYPIYQPDKKFHSWIKDLVLDLLQKPHNDNASLIFSPICRVIRISDVSVASFMLPIAVSHALVLGTDQQRTDLLQELLTILNQKPSNVSHAEWENLRLCSEAIFRVLDYLSRWIQDSQVKLRQSLRYEPRSAANEFPSTPQISKVATFLAQIPAQLISTRAVECKSFARALFHWEQHIRQNTSPGQKPQNADLRRLQEIYTEIDEPDGIDGLTAHMDVLNISQQVLGHRKAGRWEAVQSWYEIELSRAPDDVDLQVNLLSCLKESSQYDVLLNYAEGMHKSPLAIPRLLPSITEASWATFQWNTLEKYLAASQIEHASNFNVSIGQALLALQKKDTPKFETTIRNVREQVASSLSLSNTYSLGSCHDAMLKLHVLSEIELIVAAPGDSKKQHKDFFQSLDRRLEVVGSYLKDKQYILGIRRAVMELCRPTYSNKEIASAWLTSARLSRKENATHQSYNAVLHASRLSQESSTIEHARLLWKEGHSRQAIQTLQGALNSGLLKGPASGTDSLTVAAPGELEQDPTYLTARAHLLLAKWLDTAGQTHSTALRLQYQQAAKTFVQWEKGHYYLGRHYNKLLESERSNATEHQALNYLTGEMARLVVENYLRSMNYGTKYIYQTLPRVLTLWLDLGTQVGLTVDSKHGFSKDFITKITNGRKEQLALLHSKLAKYTQKLPAYVFYTALPQIVARIVHPNNEVYKYLQTILVKVVSAHPQQALWSLLAVSTSRQVERKSRGCNILSTLRNTSRKSDVGSNDLRGMIKIGERLSDQLLTLCNAGEFGGNRKFHASISRDLGFNQKTCTPNPLAVPIEAALTATLPTLTDNVRTHKAFSRDVITISAFLDDVLILSSLQKPRKITARGSDGRLYGLLCKPKDDLRKDQRLMEFNGMINRYLKRDAESSKRQLYIKTYAVTPLNEECGIIEWVDGLKTLRDVLLGLYKAKGITPNYSEIKQMLDQAMMNEEKLPLFTDKVLQGFPPVFHEWFVQQFPEPSAWFTARLKYTRSCAVMSMVGTILGLGDRHGENILFEEGNGGTFHVDFNCLFDKGLTFAQPERVPFRLTHNMVDAMGVYGFEGPFRKSSELTLALLRQHEETLMTVLEAFVYDPTLDLLAKKPNKSRKESIVPDTPQGVLDSIRRKVRGLLVGESLPLSVEGQVEELIKEAVSPKNLAAMYIGWCAFF